MIQINQLSRDVLKLFSILLLQIVNVYGNIVSAQEDNISFDHLSSSDGLSSGAVISVFQDSKGYMWFGTYDGLNLYDGHEVTVYSHVENDSTTISNSYINDIDEDKYGNLWIGTNNGLNIYHRNTGTFSKINFDHSEIENISDAFNYILTVLPDDEVIWVGTHGGLYKINISRIIEGEDHHYLSCYFGIREQDNINHSSVGFLHKDESGVLWMKNYTPGLYRYNASRDTFINVLPEEVDERLRIKQFSNVRVDKQDVFWISVFPDYLYYYYGDRLSSVSPYPELDGVFENKKFNHVIDISDSLMWLATDGSGLYIYNKNTGNINNERVNLSDPHSLSSDKISYLFKDKQNIIWVGTVNSGINFFNPKKARFNHVYPVPCRHNYLKSKGISSLAEDTMNRKLWIGTDGEGIIMFDPVKNSYRYNEEIDEKLKLFNQSIIKELFIDSKGVLWILSYLKGLYAYDPARGSLRQFSVIKQDGSVYDFREPWCITEDKNGRIWIGTLYTGVFLFNRNDNEFTHLDYEPDNENSIGHRGILDIYVDSRNILWVGTYHGLSMASLENVDYFDSLQEIKFKTFLYSKNGNSISSNRIQSIDEGANGEILIGTETGGLNIYDPVKGKFLIINTDDGLPSNKISGVAMDNKSRIWISSNKGLSFIESDRETIHNYNVDDGLQSNECKFLFKTNNGDFFIGGNNGFNYFNPDNIDLNTEKVDLYLTSVKIFGEEVFPGKPFNGRILFQDYMNKTEIPEFQYDENSISFEYLAIDYLNPSKIKYAYMLEGFDKGWNHSGNGRMANYTNLPPDNYIFKIKSTNSDGVWNDSAVIFPFTVKPPFWKTKFAYILYVILITGLIFAGRYLTIKEIKIRNELKLEQIKRENENEVNQLKLAFFTNISHELRTPLTLISGPLERLFKTAREMEWGDEILQQFSFVSRNVHRLLELTNQLLDLRKLETGKMKIELVKVSLPEFISQISGNFELMASSKNIDFKCTGKIPKDAIVYLDADKINKILSNLLSNALKFTGEGGRVFFEISYNEDVLTFEIRDTGIGIEKEYLPYIFDRFYQVEGQRGNKTPGTGIGLALTRDLVNLLNGDISVNSIVGVGTSFFVKIPLQQSEDQVEKGIGSESTEAVEPLSPERLYCDENNQDYPVEYVNSKADNTVLIVDDNPDMRKYIRGFLSPEFSVLEAINGKSGLEIAMENVPDLIISDVMMPGMDGIQMGEILKSDPRTCHIPIILLTALTSADSKVEGLKTGADDYITKPFNEEILLLKVRNHLQLRENLRQYFLKHTGLKESTELERNDLSRNTKISKIDKEFIEKVKKVVEENIENTDFSVKMLAREAGMGNTQLFMKLKALLNTSPGNLITSLRLLKAKQLLQEGELNVNEVAYKVGFTDPKYFSKCFKKYFGQIPSKYLV